MTELFNVVFSGEIAGRADPATVRANVGKLFNVSAAVLDKLFAGQPVAVKKMVDRATAMKIRALMKQAGAEARIVQVNAQDRALVTPAPVTPATAPPAPSPAAGSMAAGAQRMAEEQHEAAVGGGAASPPAVTGQASASAWGIAPVGARLSVPNANPAPAMPDVSDIVLAARGTDMLPEHEKPVITPVQVDISGITVAAAGSDVLREDEKKKVEAVVVDISGLSMAEVGAPLDEIRERKVPVNPDISHIALVKD